MRYGLTLQFALASLMFTHGAVAGEISGMRPLLPTPIEHDLAVTFSNDFLGRGGAVDDFRTQQLIISAALTDRWLTVIDHSVLTFSDGPEPGRTDQLSISLGYKLRGTRSDTQVDSLIIGTGLRSVGRYAGERMQNGFHKLVGSQIENLAYVGDSSTDITLWFDAERFRLLRRSADSGAPGKWSKGFWLRANSLVTTGGQWDSSVAILGVMSKSTVDVWLGIKSDWRRGYDDPVLRETAIAEEDVAVVLGARFGPLVVETAQQLNNDASYGQIRLVSYSEHARRVGTGANRFGLDFGFLLPNVQLRLAGRLPVRFLTGNASGWSEQFVISLGYGEPQYKNNPSVFVRSRQINLGFEYAWRFAGQDGWLSVFGAAAAGWRDEKLTGVGDYQGNSSERIGRVELTAAAGLRFSAADFSDNGRFRIQLGLVGRKPVNAAEVRLSDQSFQIQRSALDLLLGMSFEFE